jgi:hypothetical protein
MSDPNGVPFTIAPVRADDKEKTRKEAEDEEEAKELRRKDGEEQMEEGKEISNDKDKQEEDLVGAV